MFINKTYLNYQNVNPSQQELDKFRPGTENELQESDGEDEQMAEDAIANAMEERDRLELHVGETVFIVEGQF